MDLTQNVLLILSSPTFLLLRWSIVTRQRHLVTLNLFRDTVKHFLLDLPHGPQVPIPVRLPRTI